MMIALWLLACSPAHVEEPVQTPLTASTYCEATVDLWCPYYERCGRIVENEKGCRETFLEVCNVVYEPHYIALEQRGLLAISAQGVEACEQHLREVQCDSQFYDLAGPCSELWQGLAKAQSACGPGIESFVCGEGLTCVLDLSLCGACEEAGLKGAPCVDDRCDDGLYCLQGTCEARVLAHGACDDDHRCDSGLYCDGGECVSPSWSNAGEECDLTHSCRYGMNCVSGVCEPEAGMGEVCTEEVGCRSGFCSAGGVCKEKRFGDEKCQSADQCHSGACEEGRCVALPGVCFTQPQ